MFPRRGFARSYSAVPREPNRKTNQPGVSTIKSPDLLNSAIELIPENDHHLGNQAETVVESTIYLTKSINVA
jgi:hypothetical protein